MTKYKTAAEAVKVIQSGDRVFIHGVSCAPESLIEAMTQRADELRNVELIHIHTESKAPYAQPHYRNSFFINSMFVGNNVRETVNTGQGDYIPIFLSEIPNLFKRDVLPLDVALIQVSPPDKHGICSLGVSVDCTLAAVHTAQHVIAQVNRQMPRTHGDGFLHLKQIDTLVEWDAPLQELPICPPNAIEAKIGKLIAELIDDGSTLQMGIGAIPNATLSCLEQHQGLGVHSEMISDGIIDLVEKGVITGEHKVKHPYEIVTGFALGTKRLYDFLDDNPQVTFRDISYTNDTTVIRQNPKVVAINSAIEVDITGQVCADSIGTKIYSGVGGQVDFIRGASLSEGGKPIIALPSMASNGISRIVPLLKEGAGVVTTRFHVHYVITEYGIAYLYGKNLRQRAEALTQIAHPDFREELERYTFERFQR